MQELLTVVKIVSKKRGLFACAVTNEKGYRKSLENGNLWVVYPETGRLLPYWGEERFLQIEEKKEFIEVLYSDETIEKIVKNCGKPVENVDKCTCNSNLEPVDNIKNEKLLTLLIGESLLKLEKTIQDRHAQMPEGSYTTHLFKSGGEKIRKKTGEEAIELLLAKAKKEIIYESADLLYHLMVLLESERISLKEIIEELNSRP